MNYYFQHGLCLSYFPLSFFFQPKCDGETPNFDHDLPPASMSNSRVPLAPRSPCCCVEHVAKIPDLEGRLSLLKRQEKDDVDQAGRSFGLMKQVSSLESQMYDLMAKIAHLEECDSFLVGIIEPACEQLQCKFLEAPWCFWLCSWDLICLIL
jgi:hypothetical protein